MRFKFNQFFIHGEGLREVHYLPAIEERGVFMVECLWRIVEWRIVEWRRGIFEKIEVFFWHECGSREWNASSINRVC
jgi:hypothetical protein